METKDFLNPNLKGFLVFHGQFRHMPNKKTRAIRFYSVFLRKKVKESKLFVKVKYDWDKNLFRLFSSSISSKKLYTAGADAVGLVVTKETKGVSLMPGETISTYVALRPEDFGFKFEDLISDNDASLLLPYLVSHGFEKHPLKATGNNGAGDLTLIKEGVTYAIHISKAAPKHNCVKQRTTNRHRLFGKIVYQGRQATGAVGARNVVVMHSHLIKASIFNEETINFLNSEIELLLFTDFEKGWEKEVADLITEKLGNKETIVLTTKR